MTRDKSKEREFDSQTDRETVLPPPTSTRDAAQPDSDADTVAGRSVTADAPVLETFGRYRLIKLLGEGAMGAVYLAEDTMLRRQVALKIPKFSVDTDPVLLERFYREARAAAALRHTNICPVFDVGEIDGRHYIAMAYIEGRPLSDFVEPDNPAPPEQAAALVCRLADALATAHAQGVIHRDLNPANIIVDEMREPIVMDFGIARQMQSDDIRLTSAGAILGSPAYMSPEQAEGQQERMGPTSDIYSLGVILYELLTGRIPFRGSLVSVLSKILSAEEPRRPAELREGLDPRLESICLRMMAKQIEDRYQSMSAVFLVLTAWLAGDSPAPQPEARVNLTAFDAKKAIRDARLEKLARYKRHVQSLLEQGKHEAALKILKQMARLKDTRYAEYAEWARREVRKTRNVVTESQELLPPLPLTPRIGSLPGHKLPRRRLPRTLIGIGVAGFIGVVCGLLLAFGVSGSWQAGPQDRGREGGPQGRGREGGPQGRGREGGPQGRGREGGPQGRGGRGRGREGGPGGRRGRGRGGREGGPAGPPRG